MKYLEKVSYETATADTKALFDAIKSKMGRVPNIYAAMAQSPIAVKALLQLRDHLSGGVFSLQESEAIALVCAQNNGCEYCLSAHTAISQKVGLSSDEILKLRKGQSDNPKMKALTALTEEILRTKGRPASGKVEAFFQAGYNQGALSELVAQIALDIWTNYFNDIVETDIDFPKVSR